MHFERQGAGSQVCDYKKGEPAAVIIGFDEWEKLKETREILADQATVKRIKKSRLYFRRGGKGKKIKQVFFE